MSKELISRIKTRIQYLQEEKKYYRAEAMIVLNTRISELEIVLDMIEHIKS